MKQLLFFIASFFITTVIYASDLELYLQAHNAYVEGNYLQAAELFAKVPHHSFPVYYNSALSYAKAGQLYAALQAARKAVSVASGADRVKASALYRALQQQLGLPVVEHYYQTQCNTYFNYIPTLLLQLITILLALILLFCVWYHTRVFFTLLLTLGMLVSMFLSYLRYMNETQSCSLVKNEKVKLYSGPNDRYAVLHAVPQGTEVIIKAREDEWCCVTSATGSGWIAAADLDSIS
jgi:hypothetical protein